MPSFDGWDPSQYNRYAAERELAYWDLAALIRARDSARVADLGCGDGRLTSGLARLLDADAVVGVDSSRAMLEAASRWSDDRVSFELADIGTWERPGHFDVVIANASLQWVPGHRAVLARWSNSLAPAGQLAVQVPANADHPSHQVAVELAGELLENAPEDQVAINVLAPERYAEILDELGFVDQHVRLQVYVHHLGSTSDVVEWMKGTSLTRFKEPLGERYEDFVAQYRERLLDRLGDRSPYTYHFKRILLWGRRP
ncbi:MAG TPA: methyltransferase domain-containing protein [Acidimicrobiales bacterium]|nr:methyltransferase domain-containing protein [Acidimicrobiales bacterium]